ncbi:hypothetical protein GCM10027456_66790 [Kineosporia babensis]
MLLLGALLASLALATPAQAQGQNENLVKVIVVPGLNQTGGQPVTLPAVAAATLGDQNRAGEIFELNQGQQQPDGDALEDPNQQLTPGWILRLPDDASGQLVQLAREADNDAVEMDNGQVQGGNEVSLPLAAVLAVVGSVLLALVTAAIVARRRVSRWFARFTELLKSLTAPAERRRKLRQRKWLTTHFAADTDTVRRAYGTIGTLATAPTPPQVHALRVDNRGVTVWVTSDNVAVTPPAGWDTVDETRWRASGTPFGRNYGDGTACLVRVGAIETAGESEAVFVDLSRLDGVLAVGGDPTVARDVVQHLLNEIAQVQPGTPVLVLGSAGNVEIPAGLNRVSTARSLNPEQPLLEGETVRATARRQPVRAVVVGTPQQQADLVQLCGSAGAGWTGLVVGEMSAHWRWHAEIGGEVRIPVLDLEVTVPA